MEMGESSVGTQQARGTCEGLTELTRVWTIAWFVAFIWSANGNAHSPEQKCALNPGGATIQSCHPTYKISFI